MPGITLEELIAEFERLGITGTKQDEGLSSHEWAALWKCSHDRARDKLQLAAKHGLLRVGTRMDVAINGSSFRRPVYHIVLPEPPRPSKRRAKP